MKQSISIYLYADSMVIEEIRVLLIRNKGSVLFADRHTLNAVVTYNFWREHRLIAVDPNRPNSQEQLLVLNDTEISRHWPC